MFTFDEQADPRSRMMEDDEDQPLGRRLARLAMDDEGAPVPPAASPTSPAGRPVATADDSPKAPQFDYARYRDLQANKDRLSQPINPRDAGGSVRPEYRMGKASRIIGALADFGLGFSHSPDPGVYIGPGATNRRYAQDESMRQRQFESADTNLRDFLAGTQAQESAYKPQLEAWKQGKLGEEREAKAAKYENAIDPNSIMQDPSGKWYGTTYGGEKKETSQPKWSAQIDAKSTSNVYAERQAALAQMEKGGVKFDPEERKYYLANGKLREPNPDAEARLAEARGREADRKAASDERAYNNAFMRFQTQLQGYEGKKQQIETFQRTEYDKLEARFQKEFGKAQEDGDKKKMDALTKQHESEKKALEDAIQQKYRDNRAPEQPPILRGEAPAARPAPAPNAAKGPATAGPEERVRVKEVGSGRVGTIPKSQLQSALSSKKYVQVQ